MIGIEGIEGKERKDGERRVKEGERGVKEGERGRKKGEIGMALILSFTFSTFFDFSTHHHR